MKIFEKLSNTIFSRKIKKEQLERLNESIWTAISDGKITDHELDYINGFFDDSELSQEEFQKLKSEIFVSCIQQAIADRRIYDEEIRSLNHIAVQLELPSEVISWAHQRMEYFHMFAQIETGAPLQTIQPVGLILQKSEKGYLCLPATLLEERVTSRRYVGGTQGLNIRLMKGVNYRVGQQKGRMQSESSMVAISNGYFIITNKRLVFSGDRKSVSTPIPKLLDFHIYSDGLNYTASNRQKPVIVRMTNQEEPELCALIVSRIINESD